MGSCVSCKGARPEVVGKPAAADSSGSRPAQSGPRIFLSDEYSKQKLLESLSKDELAEKERILEWWELLRAGGLDHLDGSTLEEIRNKVLLGVPKRFLGSAWKAFARTAESFRPGGYERLAAAGAENRELMDAIGKDLTRTFPHHPYFADEAGQQMLRRILGAYCAACPEVGYVQGLNFIAGFILATLQQEEDAFWVLVRLLNHMGAAGFFVERTPGLSLFKAMFAELLRAHLPELDAHLNEQEVTLDLFATKWFLSMFTYSIPFDAAVAIWGIIFTDGIESLIVVALGLLKLLRKRLLDCRSAEETKSALNDLQGAMGFSGKDVIRAAIGMQVRADKMQEVREAWLARHPLDRDALAALPPSFDAGNLARAYPDLARLGLEQEAPDEGGGFRPSSRPTDEEGRFPGEAPAERKEAAEAQIPERRFTPSPVAGVDKEELSIVTKTDKAMLSVEGLPDWRAQLEEAAADAKTEDPMLRRTPGGRLNGPSVVSPGDMIPAPFSAEFGPSPTRRKSEGSPLVLAERPASWDGKSGLGLGLSAREERPRSAQHSVSVQSSRAETTTAAPTTPRDDDGADDGDEEDEPRAARAEGLRGASRAASEPRRTDSGGPARSYSAERRPRTTGEPPLIRSRDKSTPPLLEQRGRLEPSSRMDSVERGARSGRLEHGEYSHSPLRSRAASSTQGIRGRSRSVDAQARRSEHSRTLPSGAVGARSPDVGLSASREDTPFDMEFVRVDTRASSVHSATDPDMDLIRHRLESLARLEEADTPRRTKLSSGNGSLALGASLASTRQSSGVQDDWRLGAASSAISALSSVSGPLDRMASPAPRRRASPTRLTASPVLSTTASLDDDRVEVARPYHRAWLDDPLESRDVAWVDPPPAAALSSPAFRYESRAMTGATLDLLGDSEPASPGEGADVVAVPDGHGRMAENVGRMARSESDTSLVREDSAPSDAVSYLPVVSPRTPGELAMRASPPRAGPVANLHAMAGSVSAANPFGWRGTAEPTPAGESPT